MRGLLKDHNVAFSILMDLLEKGEKISLPNLSGVGERCNTLMQNAHKVSDRKDRLEFALQAVHLYPFATEPYHLLLEQYGFVDADTLNVFAYFQDDARQKALQRKIQENFCSVLDGMPEQTYEELETKLDYIKNHQQRVAKGKAVCPMLEAYEREYRSEWKKTYQEIRKKRLTSPDGILFDSPEKLELYEAERERLQPYRAALTSSDKYDTLRDLYEAGQKADFRSKEAKDVLEQLGARIKAFDTIRKEYKNSLKDYFRRTWDREIDRNELPAYAREYLRSLPETPLCAILSVYTTKVCDPQSSPQDGCIIVSDFFIAVVCSRSGGTSIPIDKIKAISRDVLGFAFSLDTDNSQRGSERKRVSFHLDYTESSASLEKFMDELSLHFP